MLDEYFGLQVDEARFFYWLRLFVPIFQLSRWLDDYVELLLGADRRDAAFSLTQLLRPRADRAQQGGGIDAPPLDRTLGIGACFVLRELSRTGMLVNPQVRPHCYMPMARVVRLLMWMGFEGVETWGPRVEQSRAIHEFLTEHLGPERATFGGDFDIPLLMVSEDPQLFLRVFERVPPIDLLADDLYPDP